MAASFSKEIHLGVVGSDIELKHVGQKNSALATFSLAVNSDQKDGPTLWVNCQVWGKSAEALVAHSGKGAKLLVEGRREAQQWKNKDGELRKREVVNVREFKFIGDVPEKNKRMNMNEEIPF